jgi:glutamine kinase
MGITDPDFGRAKLDPFEFGTKAESLERLKGRLNWFKVPDFTKFSLSQWRENSDECLRLIANIETGGQLIVRSSAIGEDGANFAFAGKYLSIGGICAGDNTGLRNAIDEVSKSYGVDNLVNNVLDHQILVQRMITDASMSGVLFTQDMNSGAPYYLINYDDASGKTDVVTSGTEYSNRTLAIHRGAVDSIHSARFHVLIKAVLELEAEVGIDFLDIEFAVDQMQTPFLLQVRRITTREKWNQKITQLVDAELDGIRQFVEPRLKPQTNVHGKQSVFGQMPDWNPAEMIGRAPGNLAVSLYRTLITDSVWRCARGEIGYKVPEGQPLMVLLSGQPYIDVRLSFHSFLPAALPDALSEKIVDCWLERLIRNPHLHDKIEFVIAETAYGIDFDDRVERHLGDLLSNNEKRTFKDHLIHLTNGLLERGLDRDLSKVNTLEIRQFNKTEDRFDFMGLWTMLEDCRALGTLPFAILARHGFVARHLLEGLVSKGVISRDEAQQLQSSVETVAGALVRDMTRLRKGAMDLTEFFRSYGHLRPGTYDIASLRYDQREEFFNSGQMADAPSNEVLVTCGNWSAKTMRAIDKSFAEAGLAIRSEQFVAYFREATAAREKAKFVFSRSVSDALEVIAHFGQSVGLNREELSHIPIQVILDEAVSTRAGPREHRLSDLAEHGRHANYVTAAIRLPVILHDVDGLRVIPFQVNQPNFVSSKMVSGACVRLGTDGMSAVISGRIVLIENADPGFDWIFGLGILGLVTKYGGVNSHMAIRCAEFDLPAVIGCGDQIFDRLERAGNVEINCQQGLITPVSERKFG